MSRDSEGRAELERELTCPCHVAQQHDRDPLGGRALKGSSGLWSFIAIEFILSTPSRC